MYAVLWPSASSAEDRAEPAAAPATGYRWKLTIEAEIDWQPLEQEPAPPDEPAPPGDEAPPAAIGGRLVGTFTATWSLVRKEAPAPAPLPDEEGLKLKGDEQALLDLTNAERQKADLPPLKAEATLMKLAREQSAAMARLERLAHDLEGRTLSIRLREANYAAKAAGENCAEGAPTPARAMSGWMSSPGHRGNIHSGDYTLIGVSAATSKSGRRYYTQVFAKPLP